MSRADFRLAQANPRLRIFLCSWQINAVERIFTRTIELREAPRVYRSFLFLLAYHLFVHLSFMNKDEHGSFRCTIGETSTRPSLAKLIIINKNL